MRGKPSHRHQQEIRELLDQHGEQILAATVRHWVSTREQHGQPPVDSTLRDKWGFFVAEHPMYLEEVLERQKRGELKPILNRKEVAEQKAKRRAEALTAYKAEFEKQVASCGKLDEDDLKVVERWRRLPKDEDELQHWFAAIGYAEPGRTPAGCSGIKYFIESDRQTRRWRHEQTTFDPDAR